MGIVEKIKSSSLYKKSIQLLHKIVIPGFDGLSLYEVGSFFIEGTKKGYISTRAYSLAFQFFIALFPLIIFLFTLIPFIPIDGFQEELLKVLSSVLPTSAYELASDTINDIINKPRGGLLSIGFALALYFSTNGVNAMINAFNKSYHVSTSDNFFKQRLNAIILLFILVLLVVIGVAVLIFTTSILNGIEVKNGSWTEFSVKAAEYFMIIALYFLGISFIYYFGSTRANRWRFISAGSTLATVLSLALTFAFGYYVNNFGTYNKIYGSIGALIVIMLWLYFNSLVLLIGYELNASIIHAREAKSNEDENNH